ncbi:hypothetical protein Moror_3958 [Moniliophthora roreri MCA 2997]|uniref:Uncharacterized protein n=1 Tax=Moniliophthora roreri (strain MCA 2997) TaxID=1381753 RepID=V2XRX1_MONRO|nr:hypothetical protein Moror_3958 [Moniliophthora roreri MCA 2997]
MAQASFASNSGQQASPFSVAQAVSSLSSTANTFHAQSSSSSNSGTSTNSSSTFRVPAHKHAHHLHSIPPREKSTRTLIIDHMLWVHGRTRFAQARAELGMIDRTGGPSSSNYKHRHRPENYEEEDEIDSDGEVVDTLKGRSAPHDEDEDARLAKQDLPLARSLRLRAEGLEKVVTSMLVQLPPVQPIIDEDFSLSSSPKIIASGQRPRHPHTLPNGVRLRLALGTVINDLFARQSPPQPFRHRHDVSSPPSATRSSLSDGSPFDSLPSSSLFLPEALTTISPISAYSSSNRNRQMDHITNHSYGQISPQAMAQGSSSRPSVPPSRQQSNRMHPKRPLKPGPRTRTLYNAGADPETANSPPAFRCPRHLHTGCEICVEAKSGARPPVGGGTGRGRSTSSSVSFGLTGGGTVANGSGSTWNSWKGTPIGIAPDGGGITGWQDGSGIGSGLLRPAVNGTMLRRKPTSVDGETVCGGGNTKLSELIPRFLRLSALVAAELGREVREAKEVEGALVDPPPSDHESSQSPEATRDIGGDADVGSPSRSQAASSAQAQDRLYGHALRPSREWYLLLAGLLTRAALQGYLSAGWRGSDAVECLLTVGLGLSMGDAEAQDSDDEFEEFEPDELPSLLDSVKMLFPALRAGAPPKKTHAEEEYELEMDDRLRKFYDIPESTPDLSTHMEDLAWQYPAEPVERAAVRFCEAIAKWRGKPELETYKKKPPKSSLAPSGAASDEIQMSIESLVHSNPTSPTVSHRAPSRPQHHHKPTIELYFLQPNDADHHLSSPMPSPTIVTTPTQLTYSVSRAGFSQHSSPSSMGSSSGMGMNLSRGMNPPSQTPTQAMPPPSTPGMIMGTNSSMWSWMPSGIGGSNKRNRSTDDVDTGPRKRLQFQQNPSHGPS